MSVLPKRDTPAFHAITVVLAFDNTDAKLPNMEFRVNYLLATGSRRVDVRVEFFNIRDMWKLQTVFPKFPTKVSR